MNVGNGSVLVVSWERLALCGLALLVVLAIVQQMRLGLTRDVLVSAARGSVQLFAVGHVLTAIFTLHRPDLVLAITLVMVAVAAHTAGGRLRAVPGLRWMAAAALATGTGLAVVFMATVVVQPSPWWSPQYVVPITGMLLGNATSGASLAGERFQEELVSRRTEVEARLCLGLSGPESVQPLLQRALRAALIPTLNAFAVAGVVQLPGMMTGQILSGVHPTVAVRYQILILVLLVASTALSTLVFLRLLRGKYLTPAHQLRGVQGRTEQGPRRTDKSK